jgi:hypothetical protein
MHEVSRVCYSSCTGRSREIYVAAVEAQRLSSGRRKDRMKLSLSSKLVEKLTWVLVVILFCKFSFPVTHLRVLLGVTY